MNSNENTPQDTIRQLNCYLEEDEQSRWLVDAYCIWDHEAHAWLDGTPVLIRTEMRDILLAWPDGAHLQVGTEPIDTYDVVDKSCLSLCHEGQNRTRAGSRQRKEQDVAANASLCWRQRPCMSHFVGTPINRFVFVPSALEDELFVYFTNGECMRIAATRIVSHMLLSVA